MEETYNEHEKPAALEECVYIWEKRERAKRKINVKVTGVLTAGKGYKKEMIIILEKFLEMRISCTEIFSVKEGALITLESIGVKREMLRR